MGPAAGQRGLLQRRVCVWLGSRRRGASRRVSSISNVLIPNGDLGSSDPPQQVKLTVCTVAYDHKVLHDPRQESRLQTAWRRASPRVSQSHSPITCPPPPHPCRDTPGGRLAARSRGTCWSGRVRTVVQDRRISSSIPEQACAAAFVLGRRQNSHCQNTKTLIGALTVALTGLLSPKWNPAQNTKTL